MLNLNYKCKNVNNFFNSSIFLIELNKKKCNKFVTKINLKVPKLNNFYLTPIKISDKTNKIYLFDQAQVLTIPNV